MSYRLSCVQLVTLLCALCFVSSSAFALGIPDVPKPKKDKERKKDDTKKTDDSKTTDETKKSGEQKSTPPKEGASKEELWAEVGKDVEPLVEKTMEAFNKNDWTSFFAQFPAETRDNKETVKAMGDGYARFHDAWGNYKSRAIAKDRSNPDYFSFGKLSYDVHFEKQNARMDINFKKLDGKFVLLALTFLNADGSFASPVGGGNVAVGEGVKIGQGGVMEIKMAKSAWDKLKDTVKQGEWVEYEYPANKMKTRMEITELGDHTYTTKTNTEVMGQKTEQSMKMIFSEPDPKVEETKEEEKVETKEFPDKVKIPGKGTEVSATRYEYYRGGKLMSKSWISKEVPAGGMVKTEGPDDQVLMQLTNYGTK